MKTFTDKPLHQFDQVKYDGVSWNLDKYLDQLNGGLDSNNLPVLSVGHANLVEPSAQGPFVGGSLTKWTVDMFTNLYILSSC